MQLHGCGHVEWGILMASDPSGLANSLQAVSDLLQEICVGSTIPDLLQFAQYVTIDDVCRFVALLPHNLCPTRGPSVQHADTRVDHLMIRVESPVA
jgi:hypothetical protein